MPSRDATPCAACMHLTLHVLMPHTTQWSLQSLPTCCLAPQHMAVEHLLEPIPHPWLASADLNCKLYVKSKRGSSEAPPDQVSRVVTHDPPGLVHLRLPNLAWPQQLVMGRNGLCSPDGEAPCWRADKEDDSSGWRRARPACAASPAGSAPSRRPRPCIMCCRVPSLYSSATKPAASRLGHRTHTPAAQSAGDITGPVHSIRQRSRECEAERGLQRPLHAMSAAGRSTSQDSSSFGSLLRLLCRTRCVLNTCEGCVFVVQKSLGPSHRGWRLCWRPNFRRTA